MTNIRPTVPWAEPSDVCVVYEGPIRLVHDGTTAPEAVGQISLVFRGGTSLEWSARLDTEDYDAWRAWHYTGTNGQAQLIFAVDGRNEVLDVQMTGDARGYVPGNRRWAESAPAISSVRATVFGMAHLFTGEWLADGSVDGYLWRSRLEFEDWSVTLDERPAHREVVQDAKRKRLPVGTHALEVRRCDHSEFSARVADDVLTGLNFRLSFAMDRWVPGLFAKGYGAESEPRWIEWAPLHVDSPNRGSMRWWNDHRPEDLAEYMTLWMSRWLSRHEAKRAVFW